jgi:hypothetical protein
MSQIGGVFFGGRQFGGSRWDSAGTPSPHRVDLMQCGDPADQEIDQDRNRDRNRSAVRVALHGSKPQAEQLCRGRLREQREMAVGRWLRVAWQPERFLSVYAEQFIDELWRYCQREYPGREFNRRATALLRPREPMQ